MNSLQIYSTTGIFSIIGLGQLHGLPGHSFVFEMKIVEIESRICFVCESCCWRFCFIADGCCLCFDVMLWIPGGCRCCCCCSGCHIVVDIGSCNPYTCSCVFPVGSGIVRGKQGDWRIWMLLDDPQGVSELWCEPLRLLNGFWTRRKTLEKELITLSQPDVHSSHGAVSEGSNDHLLMNTIIDLQHANLLTPSEGPGNPEIHVRTLVSKDCREDVTSLDIDSKSRHQRDRNTFSVDCRDRLPYCKLHQLKVVRILLDCCQDWDQQRLRHIFAVLEASNNTDLKSWGAIGLSS